MDRKLHPEYKILAELLDMASDEFSNHGCNDYELDDTPENLHLLELAHKWNMNGNESEPFEAVRYNGKLQTQDHYLMRYFARLLKSL